MTSYPNLGFNPCPGDVDGYRALADYAGRAAAMLSSAEHELASAGSEDWRGEAAAAFRAHVSDDVLPLASKANNSVAEAASALQWWVQTLAQLQAEAGVLNSQAGPWHDQRVATLAAAKLPSFTTPPYPLTVPAAQRTQLEEADSALNSILTRANNLQAEYNAAVSRTAGQLQSAGNMAPQPPGLFSSLWDDACGLADAFYAEADAILHDSALWTLISGIANVIASVAGFLALFPPLSAIFGPIALIFGGIALLADTINAIFNHGSWVSVGLDVVAVVSDVAWMKAAGKLSEAFEGAEGVDNVVTKATTYKGLLTKIPLVRSIDAVKGIDEADRTVTVAPGMFRIMGASMPEILGGSEADMKAISSVSDLSSFKWRIVDIFTSQINWTTTGIAATGIPGTVESW
jgi:hypothetical protein